MKRNIVRRCIISIFLWFFNNAHCHLQKSDERTRTEYFVKNYSLSTTTSMPNEESHTRNMNFQRCSFVHSINMIAKCPPEYADREVIRKCERGLFPLEEEDISVVVPVTNLESRVHYANRYCATCHNDSSIALWELLVKWPKDIGDTDRSTNSKEILSTLYFDKSREAYSVRVNGESRICQIMSAKPENISSSASCTPSVISECPTVYEGPKDCDRFRSNVLICTSSSYMYLNRECARCNNVSESSIAPCTIHMLLGFNKFPAGADAADGARVLYRLKKDSVSCSIPAVAMFYCAVR